MATVAARLDDAELLWLHGRREAAMLLALVALISRAKQDAPRGTSDRAALERAIASRLGVRLSVEFRGQQWPIEAIFYKWLRCELVHTGALPVDIGFMDDSEHGLSVRAGGAPEHRLLISPAWFEALLSWGRS